MDVMIIGAGGHGRVIADIIEKQGIHTIAGFVDDEKLVGSRDYGYSIIGTLEDIARLAKDIPGGIVAVGDNWTRGGIAKRICAQAPEFVFIQAIHPTACIAKGVQIGEGAAILAGSMIASNAVVGNHAILFMGALLGHDSVLEDYTSVGPMASLSGNVRVGTYTAVATGSTIIHQIKIGANTVIGAGSTVVRDIPDHVVAYGSPARVQKPRSDSDTYL